MISSSCEGTPSQVANRADDAQRLALRHLYQTNSYHLDSVYLPEADWKPMLEVLLAIDQALKDVPCDDLSHLRDVHTFPDVMNPEILISLDTTVAWVQQWRAGNQVTGHSAVDSLMDIYQLSLMSYEEQAYGVYAVIEAQELLNPIPLLSHWRSIVGVVEAYENVVVGDGNDIRHQEGNGFQQVELSIGRGDCPSGCLDRDVWTFRVYPNCEVEYMGMHSE